MLAAPKKKCVLDETKFCVLCGECDICDLDPQKICDNCGKCIEIDCDYKEILIDAVADDQDEIDLLLDELTGKD